jgi:hypothetical protein
MARLEPPSLRLSGGVVDEHDLTKSRPFAMGPSTPTTAEHLCELRVNARALRLDNKRPERTRYSKRKISIRPNIGFMHMHMYCTCTCRNSLSSISQVLALLTRHRSSELHKCLCGICGETIHLGEMARRSERSLSPLSALFTPALDGGLGQKPRRLAAPKI